MKGFVMSGLRTFSCVVVLCGAMANVAIAGPKIEARGQLGRDIGGDIGSAMGAARGPAGAAIGGQLGREIGDRVEDLIRDFIDREPQTKEPQAPREPIRDLYDYGYSFGHAW
ncbi:pantothenate kinase [Helicobacter pylori]|uniref:pantothenate kinase n=1 Tax=Helicobacter pylori TaxID=210 RepID=UPI000EB04B51|nr:pantothenate kinase [Helicobacter pylori]MDZ5337779.1 pantothenate kinase [Helicobacter pylori]RKV22101.1 pantothenate kinase [Helicobacter pylori]UOS20712.1 pantothenate kinase [Helicobacter pylori]WQT63539.1 pantothenate kinase [Helicobacter pylori]WRB81801.1 pantothenate kinase [Helicobacter pylori]